jgi:hypothetical protein
MRDPAPRALRQLLQIPGPADRNGFSRCGFIVVSIWSGPVDRSSSELLEEAIDIAWFYLQATGELGDGNAVGFLSDSIERMICRGQRNRMFLANMALIRYRESRSNVISIHT